MPKNEQCRLLKWAVLEQNRESSSWFRFFKFFLEREPLLSKISGNRTVRFRRSKKGKRSTRSKLRVDLEFVEFPQTPRGRISPYLCFIPILSVLLMFRLFEAVRGRLIGPKTWDRIDKIFGRNMEQPVAAPRLIWVHNDGFVC